MRLADALGAPGAPSGLARLFNSRLNDAAEGFSALSERLRPRRQLLFIEKEDGALWGPQGSGRLEGGRFVSSIVLRGASVEFRLSPQRCVFRDLELPARAGDFLEGVVRAQIDRLTPWRAAEAAFGWSAPRPHDAARIIVTVAAARREPIEALLDVGADAVVVSVAGEGPPITILSRLAGASSRRDFWRRTLKGAIGVSLVCGVAALAADWSLGSAWQDKSEELTENLARARAALLRRQHAVDDPASQALDARKGATPSAVVVLEALSRAIPDDAYLTGLRLNGDKVEISGLSADAAALVRLLEQSPQFSRATFTAPTTRGPEARESFRIEAKVAPVMKVSP